MVSTHTARNRWWRSTVSGSLRIDSLVTSGLVIDGSLEVTGTSIFTGGFNTGTSAATVGGAFTAGGPVTMTSGFSTPVNGTVRTLQVSGVSDLTGGFTSGANPNRKPERQRRR